MQLPQNSFLSEINIQTLRSEFRAVLENKAFKIFFLIGAIAVVQALNNVVLGRILSKDDYGRYSFLFTTVVTLVTSVVILGQATSIVRYFSKSNFADYQWKRYFRNVSIIVLGISAITVFAICSIYGLSFVYYVYLLLAIFSCVALRLIGNFLKSREKFEQSILLQNISPLIFIFFVGFLYLIDSSDFLTFATFKTISYILPVLVVGYFFFIKKKEGNKAIKRNIYSDGLFLWGIGLTQIAMGKVDNFFIVKYIDFSAVAEYTIIALLITLYDFVAQAIWNVYSQRFASHYKPNITRFLFKIALIASAITFFYVIFGKPILHFLFKGKYDHSIDLLIPFCISGCLRLLYLYPSCYLIGRSQSKTLNLFLRYNILGVALKIFLVNLGIIYFGLLGAVMSGILTWCYRNTVGYSLVFKDMKEQRRQLA